MVLAAAVAGLGFVGLANRASAASINSVLLAEAGGGFPAVVFLDDNDRSYIVHDEPEGGSGVLNTLSIGDVLRGMIEIQKIGSTNIGGSTGNNELTAVFSIKVTGKFAGGGPIPFSWTFGPDPAFGTYAGDAPGLAALVGPGNAAGAMAAFYEDVPNVVLDSGVAGTGVPGVANETLIATASNGSLWALLGPGFWDSSSSPILGVNSDALGLGGPDAPVLGAEDTPAQGAAFGPYHGPFATGSFLLPLLPVGAVGESVLQPSAPISATFSLFGKDGKASTAGILPGEYFQNNFNFNSDADIAVTVIPLPAAAWMGMGLLGAMGAVRSMRRR
jgi:hypothetical protein